MKYERIRGSIIPSSIQLLKNRQWTFPLIVPSFYFSKFFLLFLFFFSFCQTIHADKIIALNKNQLRIDEIKAISNPNERALKWVLFVFHLSNNYPQGMHREIALADSLWPVNYSNKEAIQLWTKAEIDRIQGNHENATVNLTTTIKKLESIPKKSTIENRLLSLAYSAYARLSKWTNDKDGLPFAYKALDLAIEIDYPTGEVFARNLLGEIVGYNQNDFTLALEHFKKAKALLPQLSPNDFEIINGFVICNIAKTWSDLGDIEKSIDYKLQILTEEKIQNIYLLAGIYNNLGTNYYDSKKYDLAEKALKKTLDLMKEHQLLTNQGVPLLRLGLIQLEKGNLLGASSYADAIDYWLLKYQFIGHYEILFYQFKSKIAKARMDYEQAIYFLEKAAVEQTVLHQINNANNLVKLETTNKLREIEQEIVLLEKERALNQTTINLQKLLLLGIGFIMVLSIWFGITFYEKNKEITEAYDYILAKNKNTQALQQQNSQKEQQSEINKNIDEFLKQKIIDALVINKSFLAPDLTLKKFADQIESNTSYVSKTINDGFGKNFNALINEYRIEEVLRLFHEGQHQTFTIESIYQKAGFKSKSSFQKAFKTKTGVTATHYLNHIS